MRKKVCPRCGKIIEHNKDCSCFERKEYQKQYEQRNQQNKEIRSARWSRKRKYIIKRDGGICQRCYIKYGIINSEDLQVHHIKPRIKYPELTYEDSNLICICRTCNLRLGTKEQLDFDWKPNETQFSL